MFNIIGRLQELDELKQHVDKTAHIYRAFFLTNHGTGGESFKATHNDYVNQFNSTKFWFMKKIREI